MKDVWPRARLVEIFEGIDTDTVRPDPGARWVLPDGTTVQAGDPVVTFVSRSLEPLRGYRVFMRALPRLLQLCPTAPVLIVGGDGVSYGAAALPAGAAGAHVGACLMHLKPARTRCRSV